MTAQLSNYMPADADPLLDRLREQYASLLDRTAGLVDGLARVPAKIDETTIDHTAAFVKQIKLCAKDVEAARKLEGEDYLRQKRSIDGFFGARIEQLKQAAATVERVMNAYLQAKADEERRRREDEARKAREIAEAAEAEARRIREQEEAARRREKEAEAARIAALTPKDDPGESIAAQRAAAELAARQENERRERELDALQAASRAQQEAEEAQRAALAKPADLARTRGALGGTATLVTSIEFEILDREEAIIALVQHFDDEAIEKAARTCIRRFKAQIKTQIANGNGGDVLPGIRFYEATKARVA